MMTKSKLRQAALNMIYAVLANGGDTQTFDADLFWEMAQEKDYDRFRKAHCKAILHCCRSSADSSRLLAERLQAAQEALEGDMSSAKLREDLARYAKRSAAFDAALSALQYCLGDKRRDGTEQLALCNEDVLTLAKAVLGLGEDLLPHFADYPERAALLKPLAAIIKRRGRMMEDCSALSHPLELGGNVEFCGLQRHALQLEELRPAAEKLALDVLAKRSELENLLAGLVQNYSIERVDMLDKCILLLSLYELMYNKLETPIVVSEATMLANEYSGGRSAPFIHGIIAAAAKA